ACLAGSEWLALRALGHRLRLRDAALVAAPAYAVTNSAGFSPATGTMFRLQAYRRYGLDAKASAAVALVAGAAVTVSGFVTAGLSALAGLKGVAAAARSPVWAVLPVG